MKLPPGAAAFCTAAENRFPPSLPAAQGSGLGLGRLEEILLHALSHLQVFIRPSGGFSHDITLMVTLKIKQQLESKRLFLFVTNSSVEITLTTSSILAKMGDTQSKSAGRGEGIIIVLLFYLYYLHIQGTIPEHKQNDGGRIPVVEEVFVQRIAYRCV